MRSSFIIKLIGPILLSLALAGCGDDGSKDANASTGGVIAPPSSGGVPPPPSTPPPSAVSITGYPAAQVTVGAAYEFQPSAVAPSGTTLSFSASNLPRWLTLDTASGRLSGTPGETDVGTYADIVLTASAGSTSASLPTFSIAVNPIVYGNATVSWLPPTETVDGSPATTLSGFKVYYGSSPGDLTQVLDIPNPGITTTVVEQLPSGVWYFAVTAYTLDKEESEKSNLGTVTI